MKKKMFVINKIVLSLIQIPLWFIKLFHGVGHLPNADTGEIEEVHFYHSMFENISDLDYSFMFYISIILIVASIVLALVSLKNTSKRLLFTSNVVSIISVLSFIVFFIVASTCARGY